MNKRRIAVIGLGRFGATMALEAQANGMEVLAMDISEEKVNEIADHVSEAIIADSTNAKAIAAIDWRQFMTVIVAIGSDIKNSMMTVIHLQEVGVPDLWCKVQDKYHASLMKRLGVQRIISPEEEMAKRASLSLRYPDMSQQMMLGETQYLAEVKIIQRIDKKDFLNAIHRQGHLLVAINHKQDKMYHPATEVPVCLYPGDSVLLLSNGGETKTREGFIWQSLTS
ncbi:MAG: TrkA family potassium uptake protein [Pseudohongiella sp.]|nr:TrkA family potassium uptake protein [Pseudohongiella sp.]